MKKAAFTILAAVLLLTLMCSSAFALKGDITIKAAKAYADPYFETYIGTIPKYTSVQVRAYGNYADIICNGVECYVRPGTLTQGSKDYDYIGTATLKKGANVYQRPSTYSRSVKNSKDREVLVYGLSSGYALIRSSKGIFGFVASANLSNLKAY